MKRIAFLAAVAATLCTVACNKNMDTQINEVPNPAEQEYHPLTIKIKGNAPETKATGIDPDDEVATTSRTRTEAPATPTKSPFSVVTVTAWCTPW